MNRRLPPSSVLVAVPAAAIVLAVTAFAAPEGPPREGPPPRGPADRLRAALDTNGDHELDAAEIAAASQALATLDEDGDGRLDRSELRPMTPGEFGGGPAGRPPREGGAQFRRPPEGLGPDRLPGDRPRRNRPDGPPRDAAGPRGPGPSPERFVERAMSFDADGDGKLDRAELGKFAEGMRERIRAAAE